MLQTHKHGRKSYLSVGTGGDVQTLLKAEPLRSKDRGLFTYNIETSKEPVCPRVELILKIIIILLIICLGFIKSKPQTIKMKNEIVPCTGFEP